jgi:hypothetical protein
VMPSASKSRSRVAIDSPAIVPRSARDTALWDVPARPATWLCVQPSDRRVARRIRHSEATRSSFGPTTAAAPVRRVPREGQPCVPRVPMRECLTYEPWRAIYRTSARDRPAIDAPFLRPAGLPPTASR